MKLLVLGATGQIGTELVQRALDRGDHVTALARSPEKIRIAHERLEVVVGIPTDSDLLARLALGNDAILSTLGHTDLSPSSLVTDAASVAIRAMTATSVRRLVIVSSTLVAPGGSFLTRIPRYITRHALYDSAEMEKVVQRTSLDWSILRLCRVTNGDISHYRLHDEEPPSVTASISRKTVASCILEQISNVETFQKTLSLCAASKT